MNADCVLIGEEPRIAPRRERDGGADRGAFGVDEEWIDCARDDDGPARLHGPRRRTRRTGRRARRPVMELVRYADQPGPACDSPRDAVAATFPEYMQHNVPGNQLLGPALRGLPGLPARAPRRRRARRRAALGADAVGRKRRGSTVRLGRGVRPRVRERAGADGALRARDLGSPDRQSPPVGRMLNEMRNAAAANGLRELIAPVRPTLKARIR